MTPDAYDAWMTRIRRAITIDDIEAVRGDLVEIRSNVDDRGSVERLLSVVNHQRRENVGRELYHMSVRLRGMIRASGTSLSGSVVDESALLDEIFETLDTEIERFKRWV